MGESLISGGGQSIENLRSLQLKYLSDGGYHFVLMGRPKQILPWLCLGLLLSAASVGRGQSTGVAAATSPDVVFAGLGLVRSGPVLILPAEREVHDGVWNLKQS